MRAKLVRAAALKREGAMTEITAPERDDAAIRLPDTMDHPVLTIVGDKAVVIELRHDGDMPNPCEDCDGVGMIHSLSRRHINSIDIDEARSLLRNADNVALSYYEHGLSLWYVASRYTGIIPDRQWDNVDFAGVWVPDDSVLACAGPEYESLPAGSAERRAWMEKAGAVRL